MHINIILSFRNEEENIPLLVEQVNNTLSGLKKLTYEFIFVNDFSSDNSLNILIGLQKEFPITIINTTRNFGYTPCLMAGLENANGDAVIYMDCDLQDPPELIPQMIDKFYLGVDVVHTTRISRAGENFFKLFLTKIAYRIISLFSEVNLPVDTGDYKLLSSRVVNNIIKLKEYDPYIRGLSVWVGYKQDFIFYNRKGRFKGKSKFPILTSSGPAKEFIKAITSFSIIPLYFSLIIGIITVLVSMILILITLYLKYTGKAVAGSSGILIAIAFFSGIILFTNGMIGLYVARIYNNVQGRPRYIIESIIKK
jgi:glycosyltransferase involved in cell wall biosynthesis